MNLDLLLQVIQVYLACRTVVYRNDPDPEPLLQGKQHDISRGVVISRQQYHISLSERNSRQGPVIAIRRAGGKGYIPAIAVQDLRRGIIELLDTAFCIGGSFIS